MEKLGFMSALSELEDEYFECGMELLTDWLIPFRYISKEKIRKEDLAERLYQNTKACSQ